MTKFYKFIFLNMLTAGMLISISSLSWFGMWMGLEINLLSIIPLMCKQSNSLSSEAAIKYFITQAMASSILLFSLIILMKSSNLLSLEFNKYLMMMVNSSFFIKMGAAPFHFWFPEIIQGLSWMNCLIMMTIQKIAPMVLLTYTLSSSLYLNFIIVFSSLISGLMGLNQTNLRKILAYSSINHMSWMLTSMLYSVSLWMLYFIIYSLISMNLIFMFNFYKSFHIKQFFNSINKSKIMKIFFISNILSLGGLPPFLGFLPKWIVVNFLIESKFYFTAMVIIVLTLITLYFYLRISFSTVTINKTEMLNLSMKKSNYWMVVFNMINIMSLLICTFIFYLN